MRFLFPAGMFLLILSFTSCLPESEPVSPELPPTPVLTSDSRWGVVNESYLKVLSEPASGADVNGLLRKGDIVEVISKKAADAGKSYWLEIQSAGPDTGGWVPDSSMDIYDSPAQARTAGSGLLRDD